MFKSCLCSSSTSDDMESPIPRQIGLEPARDNMRTGTLVRKGSKLQTSVEVFKCKFGKPAAIAEGDKNLEPSKDWTPIYYAVYHQREAALSHFLRTGGSPDDIDGTGQPPLCVAVTIGNVQIVKILLDAGANVDAVMKPSGETALHIAIRNSRSDLIDLILSYGPSIEVQTQSGETPLHYAASKSGSLATVVALLKLGAKYDTLSTKGQSPAEAALHANNLHGAVAIINSAHGKRHKLVKEKEMLLKHVENTKGRFSIGNDLIADIFTATCDPDSTVLVEAIKKNDAGLVLMFLEKGADPDRTTAKGLQPIFVALQCAGSAVVQALIKHNADISVRGVKGRTVLQATFDSPLAQDKAALSDIVEALLSRDADAMVTYPDGRTLLHNAVSPQLGHPRVAHMLISAGVKVNAQDSSGNTALHLATHSRPCIEVLLKHGANPRQLNLDELTPLLYATTYCDKEKEPDLESLIKLSDLRRTNPEQQNALHLAAANGLEKTIRHLLRARAETTIVDSNKLTPLLLAVTNQQWHVVPLLTIPPSINSWDEQGMSALHHIAKSIPKEPATWKDIAAAAVPFCDRGVSRSMRNRTGATPLIEAIRALPEEGLPVVEVLLMQKADRRESWNCVSHEDHKRHDALFYAATLGKVVFVETLLKRGATFNFKEWTPNRGLLDSSLGTSKQIMKLLAQYEWARRAGSLRRQSSSQEELPSFSTTFPTKELKQMIMMGLDIKALPKSPLGTSLLWAVLRHIPLQPPMPSQYLLETVKLVVEAGADPNVGTARGSKRSPSPSSPQVSRESLPLSLHPLTFVLEENPTVDIDVITYLLTKGSKLSIASPFYGGRLPLHSAAKANRMDVVDEFLLQRAEVNCEDEAGQTPIFFAAVKGYWEIVDTLLRRGAKVNIQDAEKNTPLHAAASGGSKRIVATLLRAGAKADVKNTKGLTALASVPETLEEKEKDKLVTILKDSEDRSKRDTERQHKQDAQTAAYEARLKQRKEEETRARAEGKQRKEQEDRARLQREQAAQTQAAHAQAAQSALRKEQEMAAATRKPDVPAKVSPTPKSPKTSFFKKPSLLSPRPKLPIPSPLSSPTLKQTSSTISMKVTTTTNMPKNAPRSVSSPLPPPPVPQTTSTPDLPAPPRSATAEFYNIQRGPAGVQKPLPTPRIDSGFGQKRPGDAEKPLPTLNRGQTTLGGGKDEKARQSGHELNDWLALTKMLDNL